MTLASIDPTHVNWSNCKGIKYQVPSLTELGQTPLSGCRYTTSPVGVFVSGLGQDATPALAELRQASLPGCRSIARSTRSLRWSLVRTQRPTAILRHIRGHKVSCTTKSPLTTHTPRSRGRSFLLGRCQYHNPCHFWISTTCITPSTTTTITILFFTITITTMITLALPLPHHYHQATTTSFINWNSILKKIDLYHWTYI